MSKKKLLIFIGSLTSGGAERVTVALSQYISKIENYSVVVVTLNEKSFDFYSLDKKVKRIALDMSGATSGIQKYTTNIKRMWAFRQILKKEKPDVVLGMITRQAVLSILASFGLPIKVVVSERNYPARRENHSIWELLRTFLYRYADAHVVQTKKIADWIVENTNGKQIHIIPNSIKWPLPNFKPRIDISEILQDDEKLILAVGSLKHQKGFDLLIEASSEFLKNTDSWKLVILGDMVDNGEAESKLDMRDKLIKKIKKFDLTNKIFLPGRAGNVGDWYNRADIFVLSSRYEGFPNVLLEAMASGTACVSFDCETGPSEIIQHNKTGILVSRNNSDELKKSINRLIEDSTLRNKLANSSIYVRDEYSEKNVFEKWAKLLDSLE